MIEVENVSKHFGGVKAVDHATLTIAKGSITGLIGPNGAGKTTLFNCIAGALTPTEGKITLDGNPASLINKAFRNGLISSKLNN